MLFTHLYPYISSHLSFFMPFSTELEYRLGDYLSSAQSVYRNKVSLPRIMPRCLYADVEGPNTFVSRFTYHDTRCHFEVSYFQVKNKLPKQWKLIPITMADGISLLFSDLPYERDFMIWFWECMLLYADANHPTDLIPHPTKPGKWIFDVKSTYPMRYGHGPIPIHICTELVPYTKIIADNHFDDSHDYTWNWTQLILGILALRAVSLSS
jgi:hypothetical protein